VVVDIVTCVGLAPFSEAARFLRPTTVHTDTKSSQNLNLNLLCIGSGIDNLHSTSISTTRAA